jgi:hypothetical protein
MSKERSRFLSVVSVFWMIVLLCSALSGAAFAGGVNDDDDARLVGTWRTTVRFPGVPIDFSTLMVVNPGGTMTDRFADGPRTSLSSGVWKKLHGRGRFAATYEGFEDTDSDGSFDQRFLVRMTIQLLDDDTLTATGTLDTLTLDGTTMLSGSLSGILVKATRMRVIRE